MIIIVEHMRATDFRAGARKRLTLSFDWRDMKYPLIQIVFVGALAAGCARVIPIAGSSGPPAATQAHRMPSDTLVAGNDASNTDETVSGLYTVAGEVQKPGQYAFMPKTQPTVGGAIGIAGGFTEDADPKNVQLTRDGKWYRTDLRSIKGQKRRVNDLLINQLVGHGDLIQVGRSVPPKVEQEAEGGGERRSAP